MRSPSYQCVNLELSEAKLVALPIVNPLLESACAQVIVRRGWKYSSALTALISLMTETNYFFAAQGDNPDQGQRRATG